jgi:hypothetical protein
MDGIILEKDHSFRNLVVTTSWNDLVNRDDLHNFLVNEW